MPERALADPESDPTATWAFDPARARRLTARVAAAADARRMTTTAPFTSAPLAELPVSTPDDVRAAVARARSAQPAWAARTPRERAAVLLRLHDLVLVRQSELLDLVQLESGKARGHAYEEVADVAINARWYARHGPSLVADARHPGLVPVLTRVTEVRHPKGVVGVVAPWNYPLTLAISDALPALLAGNAVVLKPDTRSVLTALAGAELLAEAGVPEDVFAVVVGDGPVVGAALVDVVDHVCFTGSTATGRLVAQQAAARLVGASLELGGKNAGYVAADADLDRAAEGAVRDCFSSAGQLCVSIERLVLHEAIADAFLDRFLGRVRHLELGAGLDYRADVGSLVSAEQLARVRAHVDDAVERGATLLAGGRTRPDVGPLFYEPTVLDNVPVTAACYREETFGPVVSVRRAGSDAEAVSIMNDTAYGLNATIWTRDTRRAGVLARHVVAGTVSVNESYIASWGSVASPMGGRRSSGLGRRHGREGILRFTDPQTIAVQRSPGFRVLYAQGPERFAAIFTGLLQAARTARLPWP
ncbi:MAG TPA: succinic semialdehyde dehydrogenase [Kineosporiaceae bacterium]|nr:succinic semialdehyde dehydrogenase [Kineosporiaceae bacterium]